MPRLDSALVRMRREPPDETFTTLVLDGEFAVLAWSRGGGRILRWCLDDRIDAEGACAAEIAEALKANTTVKEVKISCEWHLRAG
jgi:hypothetical protein